MYRSRLTVLLRDALEMGSKTDLPQTLRVEAALYFESLQNAQRATKKRPEIAAWLEQGEDCRRPLPDASVRGPAVLCERTT